MAFDFLTNSHRQYKADTDAVATWLVATAQKCGVPNPDDAESADRHNYFIGIREHVRDTLRPRMASDQVTDPLTQSTTSPVGDTSHLANRFDTLHVEEPSKAFLQAPSVTIPTPTGDSEVAYEAEQMHDLDEATFALTLLLEDWPKLRHVIKNTWRGYKDSMFDIVATSLMTNSAIDIARHMLEDIEPLRERPGDDINFRTYDLALTVHFPTFQLLNAFRPLVGPKNFLPYKRGYYGTYDPASDRSKKSHREKFLEDKIIMMEMLSELLTLYRITGAPKFQDEFTGGLRIMFSTKEIPLWLCFQGHEVDSHQS
ncbi:hypothetical protein BJX70DRAFT_402899 [Aspergillus crustosus]